MSGQADRLAEAAQADIGYLEKKSTKDLEDKTANAGSANYTKYGAWYGDNGVPWCAQAVSYWAAAADIPEDIVPKHESCGAGVSWFRGNGRWMESGGYAPERGDLIYFTKDGVSPCHVGVVTASDGGTVYTVEGNTSGGPELAANGGCVAAKCYSLSYGRILGYGHPEYIKEKDDYDMTIEEAKKELTDISGTGHDHSEWADEAVEKLVSAGIVSGDGEGNYGGDSV